MREIVCSWVDITYCIPGLRLNSMLFGEELATGDGGDCLLFTSLTEKARRFPKSILICFLPGLFEAG